MTDGECRRRVLREKSRCPESLSLSQSLSRCSSDGRRSRSSRTDCVGAFGATFLLLATRLESRRAPDAAAAAEPALNVYSRTDTHTHAHTIIIVIIIFVRSLARRSFVGSTYLPIFRSPPTLPSYSAAAAPRACFPLFPLMMRFPDFVCLSVSQTVCSVCLAFVVQSREGEACRECVCARAS